MGNHRVSPLPNKGEGENHVPNRGGKDQSPDRRRGGRGHTGKDFTSKKIMWGKRVPRSPKSGEQRGGGILQLLGSATLISEKLARHMRGGSLWGSQRNQKSLYERRSAGENCENAGGRKMR